MKITKEEIIAGIRSGRFLMIEVAEATRGKLEVAMCEIKKTETSNRLLALAVTRFDIPSSDELSKLIGEGYGIKTCLDPVTFRTRFRENKEGSKSMGEEEFVTYWVRKNFIINE